MSKVVAPRDTKPDSARELTNSNPFLARSSKRKNRRMFFIKPNRRRTSPDQKSGYAILDREFFTKSHTLDLHSGKTVDPPILSRESEDSPRSVSTGGTTIRKKGG